MQDRLFKLGQWSITGCLVGIAISPPVANLFFFLALVLTPLSRKARGNLTFFLKSQIGTAFLLFFIVLISGLAYGIEEKKIILSELWGWRKLLCIPIAAAFFINEIESQKKVLLAYVYSMTFFAVYSFITFFYPELAITKLTGPGIVARNHVTQGIMFSFGALIGFFFTLQNYTVNRKKALLFFLLTITLCLNTIFIATGRSGHVALWISAISFIYFIGWLKPKGKNLLKGVLTLTLISFMMIFSPAASDRIKLMNSEFKSGIAEDKPTSVGLRLTFWRNTVEMIPNQPIIGVGTGGFSKAYEGHLLNKYGEVAANKTLTVDPHNQYLKILIEQGGIGLFSFTALLLTLLWSTSKTQTGKLVGIPMLLSIIATSLFNSHFSTFNEGMVIYLFCGILLTTQTLGASPQAKPI